MQGFVDFTDASVMSQELVSARPAIPFVPAGLTLAPEGAAPNVLFPQTALLTGDPNGNASPGSITLVPVNSGAGRLPGATRKSDALVVMSQVSTVNSPTPTDVHDLALLQILAEVTQPLGVSSEHLAYPETIASSSPVSSAAEMPNDAVFGFEGTDPTALEALFAREESKETRLLIRIGVS